eukprot:2237772-Amphidinium_carterae.1
MPPAPAKFGSKRAHLKGSQASSKAKNRLTRWDKMLHRLSYVGDLMVPLNLQLQEECQSPQQSKS